MQKSEMLGRIFSSASACIFRIGLVVVFIATSTIVCESQDSEHSLKTSYALSTLTEEFGNVHPVSWAENLPGVMRYLDLPPQEQTICLTLDACGSLNDGYDRKLLDFLIAEQIHASLFINARWIDKNMELFRLLADNPLFDLQNHGMNHLPASVNGRSVYGLKGTSDIAALVDEVESCRLKIAGLTGIETTYYRSGTAYYDEVAIKVVNRLGQKVAGFSVLGDAGCTYTAEQVEKTISQVQANDIIIAHMNHPEKQTAEGLIPALKKLKERGFVFTTLRDAPTRHTPPQGYRPSARNLALDINVYPPGPVLHK